MDAVEHAHEGGLARARQAHDDEDLALADVEARCRARRPRTPSSRAARPAAGRHRACPRCDRPWGRRPSRRCDTKPWRSASRPRNVPPPGSGPRRTHRTDRQIVGPAAARAQVKGCGADNRRHARGAQPRPSTSSPATTSAMPTYWFATGRSCRKRDRQRHGDEREHRRGDQHDRQQPSRRADRVGHDAEQVGGARAEREQHAGVPAHAVELAPPHDRQHREARELRAPRCPQAGHPSHLLREVPEEEAADAEQHGRHDRPRQARRRACACPHAASPGRST